MCQRAPGHAFTLLHDTSWSVLPVIDWLHDLFMRAHLVCVVAPGAEEHRSLLSHGLFASVYFLLPQVAGSESYGWHDHDLRRGHAKDLQKSRHT